MSNDSGKREKKSENESNKEEVSETIRVNVDILDNLMNQVGELVLIRNQVQQVDIQKIETNEFMNLSQRLNIVTSEIQNEIMRTRMQPVGKVLSKFNRVVRDISQSLDKKIRLELEGTETELDKSLVEAIKDPMTHIVRNSCDHGIETPAERIKAGKPEQGRIIIRSYHEGGQVVIEINDDGKGLNREALLQKAVEKQILSESEGDRMSDKEVFSLIMHPGFSTAEKVSNLSGRGVGMDVVKSNIEQIGGMVELNSITGMSTTLKLKIPLTLAILPALIIKSGGLSFAIPQVKLVELLRLEVDDQGKSPVEDLQGQPMYRLRGELLPLVLLNKILNNETEENNHSSKNIAVLRSDSSVFGLIMDDIKDSADIVVKPLAPFLKSLEFYSGATVMGDGSIALVLDINGLSTSIKLENKDNFSSNRDQGEEKKDSSSTGQEYLVVDIGQQNPFSIALELVNRLEEFKDEEIEITGNQRVVQYRGLLLPLIQIVEHLGLEQRNQDHSIHNVVVISHNNMLYGLEVLSIEDVFSSTDMIDTDIRDRQGILGNIIHQEEVYVVLDVIDIIEKSGVYEQNAIAALKEA